MLHIERVRQAMENAIINGEHRLYEGTCAVTEDGEGRWQPADYREGVCPASVICLGDYVDGAIHERATEKLGVSTSWLDTFIRAFDGNSNRSSDIQEAWEMGIYFRAKYLFKDGWSWNEDLEEDEELEEIDEDDWGDYDWDDEDEC